jgi:hypothetical protein
MKSENFIEWKKDWITKKLDLSKIKISKHSNWGIRILNRFKLKFEKILAIYFDWRLDNGFNL